MDSTLIVVSVLVCCLFGFSHLSNVQDVCDMSTQYTTWFTTSLSATQ